jgi:hypothetical protein
LVGRENAPRYAYSGYETGEREPHDLRMEPYQLKTLYASGEYQTLVEKFRIRLRTLKDCAADSCREAEDP